MHSDPFNPRKKVLQNRNAVHVNAATEDEFEWSVKVNNFFSL